MSYNMNQLVAFINFGDNKFFFQFGCFPSKELNDNKNCFAFCLICLLCVSTRGQ